MKLFAAIVLVVGAWVGYEECKVDCEMDWTACVGGCVSVGNPSYCHANCKKHSENSWEIFIIYNEAKWIGAWKGARGRFARLSAERVWRGAGRK